MNDPKALVTEYLHELSGHAKTPELIARYVSDEHLANHIVNTEASFPKYEIIIDDLLAEGNKVVLRGQFRGAHRGAFARIEPTGRTVTAGLTIIYEIANTRIAHHWMQFDLFTLIQQLQEPAVPTANSESTKAGSEVRNLIQARRRVEPETERIYHHASKMR
jgi:predicted ester cyclase